MSSFRLRHAEPADAPEAAALVIAVETALAGASSFSLDDLVEEWRELDLARMAWVVADGERIVGYGWLEDRGELWRADAYVHPGDVGRGAGTLLAVTLEEAAAERGARRVQNGVLEADESAHALLRALGYRDVRRFREMRVELSAASVPAWPEGIRVDAFDFERDAHAFHAAHQEAFADHWEFKERPFDEWRASHMDGPKFDPSLWCVAWEGDEIAAGTICIADQYGGGWVSALFTRRPWRRRGLGAALLADAFARFHARGEQSVGLGVDAESDTGAFRLYERAGMQPAWAWVLFEKALDG